MFSNIGGKIKGLAAAICVIGIGISIICGVLMIIAGVTIGNSVAMIGAGFAILIVGSLLSWVRSSFAYGFGELIENTAVIADLMAKADAEKSSVEIAKTDVKSGKAG